MRDNGRYSQWTSHYIKIILDNPVYAGKIAYGRRTWEKVKGTKNTYTQIKAQDYLLENGQHEAIISEDMWNKTCAKRKITGVAQPSKVGRERSHLLTGILRCPECGGPMYANKNAWTKKDGTYVERYYYVCSKIKFERAEHCTYQAHLRKEDIEPYVIEAIKELVSDKTFANKIKERIGDMVDTVNLDNELKNYAASLREAEQRKVRLESEIDSLFLSDKHYERKKTDMQQRLDGMYDTIEEIEKKIDDAQTRKDTIERDKITIENIYGILRNFSKFYDKMNDEEKKTLVAYLIKEIQIYPNTKGNPLRSIEFNFPICKDEQGADSRFIKNRTGVETLVRLVLKGKKD